MSSGAVHRLRFGSVEVVIEAPLPEDADALVRDAESKGDAERGYWAHLWPTSMSLAGYVARSSLIGSTTRVLEVGCGVGLVGIVAAKRGAEVVLTDYSEDAVAAAARNIALNGVAAAVARFDWRAAPDPAWRPDVLLGADVLYFKESHEPIARLIACLGCLAILGYPNRPRAAEAIGLFEHAGLRVWDTPTENGRVLFAQA